MPGYVSIVSGLSASELEAEGDGATPSAALRPVLRGIGLFVAGFTLVFVALGATASSIGRILRAHEIALTHVSGIIIVVLGVVMLLERAARARVGQRRLGHAERGARASPASIASTYGPPSSASGPRR